LNKQKIYKEDTMTDQEKFDERSPDQENLPATQESPMAVIQAAIARGADLEKLEKLMELQREDEKWQAKKAYHAAMAAFKENPPAIEKDQTVDFGEGKAKYKHASLANVAQKIGEALSPHGLSASWQTTQPEKGITVTCTITHILGHSENTSLTAAPDNSGSKNAIQAIGSTVSYLERYTVLALAGLATFDMDNDGNAGGEVKYIDDKQLSQIVDMLNETEADHVKFLEWIKAEKLEQILEKNFKNCMVFLDAKLKYKQEGKKK
jgi:hypothetical protein